MRTQKIKSSDFDFEGFLDTIGAFIEDNFGSDSPAETMRYFYSFENESNKATADKDVEKWEMEDFKNAILQGGETIFFPFSSGLQMDCSVSLASGEIVQLSDEYEEEVSSIGLTDCYGFLVNLTKDKFLINSAIAWGDMVSTIEPDFHPKIDKAMNEFLKSFKNK